MLKLVSKVVLAAAVVTAGVYAQADNHKGAKKADAGKAAKAEVYKVDAAASTITWKGTKISGGAHNGTIAVKEGTVDVDKNNNVTGGNIVVDMKTIKNLDMASSPDDAKKLEGHLSSEDFFNVEKNPTATFKILKVEKKGEGHVATGELTFLGSTHPVLETQADKGNKAEAIKREFPVTVKFDKGVATAEGTLKIDRTVWGQQYGSKSLIGKIKGFTMDKAINDEFELGFKITAKK